RGRMIYEQVVRAVEDHGLIRPDDRILVAVSGGSDSVALIRLLVRYGRRVPLTLVVAHVHHGLRGVAADEDLEFVQRLAGRLGRAGLPPEPRGRGARGARGRGGGGGGGGPRAPAGRGARAPRSPA